MTKVLAIAVAVMLAAANAAAISDGALEAAIRQDDVATLRAALDQGTPTSKVIPSREDRGDLLTIAAYAGARTIVDLLLARHADVDGQPAIAHHENEWGHSPLYLAARAGHTEVVETLLRHGANASLADNAGFAPVHAAAAFGRIEAIRALLRAGVSVNARSTRGDTPLKVAAMRRQSATAIALLGERADPNLRDERGDTALHEAVRARDTALVRELLAAGAQVTANNYGRTPLDDAKSFAPDLVKLIEQR
jgi:ankyrin repeat protein